jgi:hypothetical protein
MVAGSEIVEDRSMTGLRFEHARLDVTATAPAEGPGGHRDSLSRATESLMQTAAVVRMSARTTAGRVRAFADARERRGRSQRFVGGRRADRADDR